MALRLSYTESQLSIFYYPLVVGEIGQPVLDKISRMAVQEGYQPAVEGWVNGGGQAITLTSEYGDSQIVLTDSALLLNSTYKSKGKFDSTGARNKVVDRADLAHKMVDTVGQKDKKLYLGCSIVAGFELDWNDSKIIGALKAHLGGNFDEDIVDIAQRFSTVSEDAFYTNTSIENYRMFSTATALSLAIRVDNEDADSRGIRFQIDHNTRLAYNLGKPSRITLEDSKSVTRQAFAIAESRGKSLLATLEKHT